ncbi:hypothetical protein [Thiomicrorhabdus sp.]|uniref:hypothetical protein n=1 Tax=Thiomicrorhabdus sp. TaxID=2039724 RepID=UPI0029C79F24|nr:hypothetical protein [Thiomicrorhabdus sp.]
MRKSNLRSADEFVWKRHCAGSDVFARCRSVVHLAIAEFALAAVKLDGVHVAEKPPYQRGIRADRRRSLAPAGNIGSAGPSPELGEISWLWRRGDLLAGVADARIVWRLQDSRLTAETSHTLTASELRIHSARGRLSMPSLLSLAAAFTPFAMEAEGIVNLDELHGAVAFAPEVWPVAMQGKGSLDGVKWMGIDLPRIDFVLKQNAKRDLQIALKGGEGGWRLTGDLILSPNGRYNLNVDVTASRAEELPQWTVMMRKKRRNQAVLKLGGSWL